MNLTDEELIVRGYSPDDRELLASWNRGPDPKDAHGLVLVLVGRFQRAMNWIKTGQSGGRPSLSKPLTVDGVWGPASDALYRELLGSHGDRDSLVTNDRVQKAIAQWRTCLNAQWNR